MNTFSPMLCKPLTDALKKKIIYPVIIQPKLDGIRFTAEITPSGKIQVNSVFFPLHMLFFQMWSRSGKTNLNFLAHLLEGRLKKK